MQIQKYEYQNNHPIYDNNNNNNNNNLVKHQIRIQELLYYNSRLH